MIWAHVGYYLFAILMMKVDRWGCAFYPKEDQVMDLTRDVSDGQGKSNRKDAKVTKRKLRGTNGK